MSLYARDPPSVSEQPEALPPNPPGFLPVYVRYRNARSRVTTEVRRVQGDVDVLAGELTKVCWPDEVTVKATTGNIEIKNNHTRKIRMYLASLGF